MKRIFFYIAACITATCFMSSCDEHIKVIDRTLKVGNIYCTDGTTVPPEDYPEYGCRAVGVVVAVAGPEEDWHSLVMALEDLPEEAVYTDTLMNVSNVSSSLTELDGKQNTSALLVEGEKEPRLNPQAALNAAAYAEWGITGWHLPSVAEMGMAARNRAAVNRALDVAGGQRFDNQWYHTSTADGSSSQTAVNYNYCVIMPEGNAVSSIKTSYHKVRPFLMVLKYK